MSKDRNPDPYTLDGGAASGRPAAAPGAGEPRFDALERRGIHVITLLRSQVLDAHEIETLSGELQAYVKRKHAKKVILDLQGVRLLSSAALGMLLTLKSMIEGAGGAMCLANVRDDLKQIFKLTKLHKVLKIKESVDAAAAVL